MTGRLTDRIRRHVIENLIQPARDRGQSEIHISVSEVLKALDLPASQAPAVRSALRGKRFLEDHHLALEKAEAYTCRFLNAPPTDEWAERQAAFLRVRGIAEEAFRKLGGGEAFIRRERADFFGTGTREQD